MGELSLLLPLLSDQEKHKSFGPKGQGTLLCHHHHAPPHQYGVGGASVGWHVNGGGMFSGSGVSVGGWHISGGGIFNRGLASSMAGASLGEVAHQWVGWHASGGVAHQGGWHIPEGFDFGRYILD